MIVLREPVSTDIHSTAIYPVGGIPDKMKADVVSQVDKVVLPEQPEDNPEQGERTSTSSSSSPPPSSASAAPPDELVAGPAADKGSSGK